MKRFLARAEALGPRSQRWFNLGGTCFLATAALLLAVLLGEAPPVGLLGVLLGIALSAAAIARYARLQKAADAAWRWWRVNANGECRCRDDWRSLPDDGSEFSDPEHPHTSDLDVFGPGSLFQAINTGHTEHGRRALARLLSERAPLGEILARQAAVRALAPELRLRQRLETLTSRQPPGPAQTPAPPPRVTGRAAALARPDESALLAWAESPPKFLPRTTLLWAARILPLLTLSGFVANRAFAASPLAWQATLFLQAGLVILTRRDAGTVAGVVARWQGVLTRLAEAFRLVEGLPLEAPALAELREGLRDGGRRASAELERLDHILGWLALRNSEWAHPPANILLSWDVHCMVALERWQRASGRQLRRWLEALGQFEALCSLAGAAHDNPDFSFPELVDGPARLSAVALGHPLIAPGARVDNDVCLRAPGHALLVTGSNMSGKSTLLRALGLASVMAFAGGPVCARRLSLSPLGVYTSLRVGDSLSEGVSRFYAELRRLRMMLDASRGPLPVLFLIDEILVGTNSAERIVGARWILSELLEAGALGAVSTHDSGLCQLPAELMDRVERVHFRESFDGAALRFDFRLHAGPVRGGNALRLMRSLGLAIP